MKTWRKKEIGAKTLCKIYSWDTLPPETKGLWGTSKTKRISKMVTRTSIRKNWWPSYSKITINYAPRISGWTNLRKNNKSCHRQPRYRKWRISTLNWKRFSSQRDPERGATPNNPIQKGAIRIPPIRKTTTHMLVRNSLPSKGANKIKPWMTRLTTGAIGTSTG